MSRGSVSHPVFLLTGKQGFLTSDSQDCNAVSHFWITPTNLKECVEQLHKDASQESQGYFPETPYSAHTLCS